jgi:hypothetical protein
MAAPYRERDLNVLRRQVNDWGRTVAMFVSGYEFGLDDYLNDLSVRVDIADTVRRLDTIPSELTERLASFDERLARASRRTLCPLWPNFTDEAWNNSLPSNADPDLINDASSRGIL